MIRKLLIIRKPKIQTDTIKEAGLEAFVVGTPLSVSPSQWSEEAGESHYGYVLEMKLKEYEVLTKWIKAGSVEANASTVLDIPDDKKNKEYRKWLERQTVTHVEPTLAFALYKVGLRIHPSAE